MTDEHTLWEIIACVDGVNLSRGLDGPEAMTGEEFEDMAARHLAMMQVKGHA